MRKSKNRHFYHIFPPGDPPGAITLNVAWIEREFDAYKFASLHDSACAHLTITVSEIEWDIGEDNGWKAGFFIPPCIRRPR